MLDNNLYFGFGYLQKWTYHGDLCTKLQLYVLWEKHSLFKFVLAISPFLPLQGTNKCLLKVALYSIFVQLCIQDCGCSVHRRTAIFGSVEGS